MPTPTIAVPSPAQIHQSFFPNGVVPPAALPAVWSANLLLTPFGGAASTTVTPPDQVMVGYVTYDGSNPAALLMRVRLHLLESLEYFDLLFRTTVAGSTWWTIKPDPSNLDGIPAGFSGPFSTQAVVPHPDFLAQNAFSHVGGWNVLNRPCNAYSGTTGTQPDPQNPAQRIPNAGTWWWLDQAARPTRMMNVGDVNPYGLAILGSFYLVDFAEFTALPDSNLAAISAAAGGGTGASREIVTYHDLLSAQDAVPAEYRNASSLAQIQRIIPGLSFPNPAPAAPAWTNKVSSDCIMMAQDLNPIYCQVWYDWDFGQQTTVFVFNDGNGNYTVRQDEVLPKGKIGPAINYTWNGATWVPDCCEPGVLGKSGGVVPMPVPNFVSADNGRCRALIQANPHFGDLSVWSVSMGGDFWYWFRPSQTGVIFSLAPAVSLTLIDYQTFVQNPNIAATTFDNPCGEVPQCGDNARALTRKRKFMPKRPL